MCLLKYFLGLACFCASISGANLSVSVGFPSAPESQGCSKTGANNRTASCTASLGDSQGTALASVYGTEPNSYVVLGALHTTQPYSSATTVKSSLTVLLDEFKNLTTMGGVRLTHNCSIDCEPIQISANGVTVGTLLGNDSCDVPYTGTPLAITLFAIEGRTAPGTDYVGLFDVNVVAY
jgi:hypothetical protein